MHRFGTLKFKWLPLYQDVRATVMLEMRLSVSTSHYSKFRYHIAAEAIKADLCGQKLKWLLRGAASTATSAWIGRRMLYKSPCKTELKAERISLPESSGISEDGFYSSQRLDLTEKH